MDILSDPIHIKRRLLDDDDITITISSSSGNKSNSSNTSSEASVYVDLTDDDGPKEDVYRWQDMILKKFYDYKPLAKEYFTPIDIDEKCGLSVVIPFFNEESHELQQTLNSLYDGYNYLRKKSKQWHNKPMYVCLIQDGWQKASKSMKNYLKYFFDVRINGKGWWDYFPELNGNNGGNATFIFERPAISINPQTEFLDDPKWMHITLIVKANNRRKHNSHEWFLSKYGFAEATKGKYLFLTDAFTLYSEKCIYYLVKELDHNKHLSGTTGRQRVMVRDQQGSKESIFSFGCILRMIQMCDFEFANAVYNGAFSLGGLLPVLPGPCGMYTTDILQDKVRDAYFDVVNKEPSETGLIEGNLKIAEDRILTYYSVTKTSEERYLSFNPLAVFYFEAETELNKLMFQRRRWINGSVCGYIYLLFLNFNDFKEWHVNIVRKIYVWILLMSQLIIYIMVGFAPGISLRITFYGIAYFLNYYHVESNLIIILLAIGSWLLYLAHIFVHHAERFNYLIMTILVLFSLVTSLTLYAVLFHVVFIASQQPIGDMLLTAHPIVWMAIVVFLFPFVNALFLSGRGHSFMYMIKSFIQYTLFIPLLITWIGSYAYSRLFCLDWGNRPEIFSEHNEEKELMTTKFKEKTIYIMLILVVLNIAIFFVPLIGQLYFMGIFFVIALWQMFLSFIFCLSKMNYKIKMIYKNYKK